MSPRRDPLVELKRAARRRRDNLNEAATRAQGEPLHVALVDLYERLIAMKRNVAHALDLENPEPYRRAAAAALLANAAAAAGKAAKLGALNKKHGWGLPVPTDPVSLLLVSARARWLRKGFDRVQRLWTERVGRPEDENLHSVIADLDRVMERIRE